MERESEFQFGAEKSEAIYQMASKSNDNTQSKVQKNNNSKISNNQKGNINKNNRKFNNSNATNPPGKDNKFPLDKANKNVISKKAATTCSYCSITFNDLSELRTHCQTESHQNVIMSDEGKRFQLF